MSQDPIPRIIPVYRSSPQQPGAEGYTEATRHRLQHILPAPVREALTKGDSSLLQQLPYLSVSPLADTPTEWSVFLLCPYRSNAFKFFFEMISRWLVPGKRLDVSLFHASDFRLEEEGEKYTFCEVTLHIENDTDMELIQKNLPVIQSEILMGLESEYYARRILEIRGLAADEKTALIQEYITHLVKRLPTYFGADVFTVMQHMLVLCPDEFKLVREYRHLSRLISYHYLFAAELSRLSSSMPSRRHIKLKFMPSRLHVGPTVETVWGVFVGLNFVRENEVFEASDLLKAIQSVIPESSLVPGSVFPMKVENGRMATLYLEIRLPEGQTLSVDQIQRLKRVLPAELKERIGHLIHPVFMPPNEEEVMRNILTLSNQLRYLRDIPQVMITFEEQSDLDVSFLVVLLRVKTGDSVSVQQMFRDTPSILKFVPDRCKTVGLLRRRYPKEANVFRVQLPKSGFVRSDYSLDLHRARQAVVDEITRITGEFRDFNGGMISKQNETLAALCHELGPQVRGDEMLLERFFYSLVPATARSVFLPQGLAALFNQLRSSIEQDAVLQLSVDETESSLMGVLSGGSKFLQEDLCRALSDMRIPSTDYATSLVVVDEVSYLALYLNSHISDERTRVHELLESLVNRELAVV